MKNVLKHYNSISYKDFSYFSILNLNRRTNQCYRIAPIKICFPPPVPQGGGRFLDQQIRGEKGCRESLPGGWWGDRVPLPGVSEARGKAPQTLHNNTKLCIYFAKPLYYYATALNLKN